MLLTYGVPMPEAASAMGVPCVGAHPGTIVNLTALPTCNDLQTDFAVTVVPPATTLSITKTPSKSTSW